MFETKITNIFVLKDRAWVPCEIGIEGGQIVEMAPSVSGQAKEEIDGDGAFCFPGAVDLHAHFNEPGRTNWEGFEAGSAAAAVAGITYLAEMPLNSIPSTVSVDALQLKLEAVEAKSYVDFGLWGGLVPGNIDEIEPLAEAGVMGFKAFMSPSGTDDFQNSDTATLREGMKRIAPTGLRLALHAEDPAVLESASAGLTSKESAFDWERSRPIEAEISAVKIASELAGETGCPITIVHVSAPEVLEVIHEVRAKGIDILCETCPHYLLLSIEDAAKIGTVAKCAPPLRPSVTVQAMLDAFSKGWVDTLGSDHSPSPSDLKLGKTFYDAWGGISGIQYGHPMLIDAYGLHNTDYMAQLQLCASTVPASMIGLTAKGTLEIGMDADFSLIKNLDHPEEIREDDLLYRHKQSAYCGLDIEVEVISTWLRGDCIAQRGKTIGQPRGRFISSREDV
ncbi:MAG: allantoinase AllB [Verrucomicrobiota bacterium]